MISAMSSSDSAVLRLTFLRLWVSDADTTASISVSPLSSARTAPRRFGTRAEYRTPLARSMPAQTASASAICGIASGRTNETASIRCTPVADSRSISSILACVGTGCSFCSPSLGPTSRTEIWRGKSDTGGLVPGKYFLAPRLTRRSPLVFLPLLLIPGEPRLLVFHQLEQCRLHVLDVRDLGQYQLAMFAGRFHHEAAAAEHAVEQALDERDIADPSQRKVTAGPGNDPGSEPEPAVGQLIAGGSPAEQRDGN